MGQQGGGYTNHGVILWIVTVYILNLFPWVRKAKIWKIPIFVSMLLPVMQDEWNFLFEVLFSTDLDCFDFAKFKNFKIHEH